VTGDLSDPYLVEVDAESAEFDANSAEFGAGDSRNVSWGLAEDEVIPDEFDGDWAELIADSAELTAWSSGFDAGSAVRAGKGKESAVSRRQLAQWATQQFARAC
jgi:hypothetical protein